MELQYNIQHLNFEFPFNISHEAKSVARTVIVEIFLNYKDKKYTGIGEAVPSKYYGEDADTVVAFYDELQKQEVNMPCVNKRYFPKSSIEGESLLVNKTGSVIKLVEPEIPDA